MRLFAAFLILLCLATPLYAATPPDSPLPQHIQDQLTTIASMVLPEIPPSAPYKRFTYPIADRYNHPPIRYSTSAWLISTDDIAFHVVDFYGAARTINRKDATCDDITLQQDALALLSLRNLSPQDRQSIRFPSLANFASFHIEADFRPLDITLPEALVAAWAFQRGDTLTAAALIPPKLTNNPDPKLLTAQTLAQIGSLYRDQMLATFTLLRDYPRTISIAEHLRSPAFAGWRGQPETAELAAQLKTRSDDFKTLTLPTDMQWAALSQQLDRAAQIKYLCARLRLIHARQMMSPGSVNYFDAQSRNPPMTSLAPKSYNPDHIRVINPFTTLLYLKLQPADIPFLLPYLDDENFLLAIRIPYRRNNDYNPDRLERVHDLAVKLINDAANHELIPPYIFPDADSTERARLKANAAAWAAANFANSRLDLLKQAVSQDKDPDAAIRAAKRLTGEKQLDAIPLFHERIAVTANPQISNALAQCCYYLAPEKSVTEARKWLADPKGPRFWAALILLTDGNRENLEALPELQTLLANDDDSLTLHHAALPALLTTKRPESIAVAAGAFKVLNLNPARSIDEAELIHRLFLAGSQEAFDHLITRLDDTAFCGTTSIQVDGKPVEIKLTRADTIALNIITPMRADKYRYPLVQSPQARSAECESLKSWLKEQMTLIHAGKPSLVKPFPWGFSRPSWTRGPYVDPMAIFIDP